MHKPFRVYRGINIYRQYEVIPGSDLKELKNGEMKEVKPKKELVGFHYADGFPYDTIHLCEQAIDQLYRQFEAAGGTNKVAFRQIMNTKRGV